MWCKKRRALDKESRADKIYEIKRRRASDREAREQNRFINERAAEMAKRLRRREGWNALHRELTHDGGMRGELAREILHLALRKNAGRKKV